jgi:hypothetical protein
MDGMFVLHCFLHIFRLVLLCPAAVVLVLLARSVGKILTEYILQGSWL